MILVTGGAGYIGCVLVRELLNKGESVRVFDKLFFGDEGLSAVSDRVDLIQGDVRSIDEEAFGGVDAVVHLAGLSNDPTAEYNPRANYEMNTIATERMATMAKKLGVRRFTFASTASIYDRGLFSDDLVLDETAEVAPRAAYAVSNYDAEKILLRMADDEFCPVIFRQGTVYGYSPRMRYDLVVNTFVKDALSKGALTVFGGGEMWRPLVDVLDVAKAHICAVEAPEDKVRGQIFNLSHKNFRILELAHWAKEALADTIDVDINVDYSPMKGRSYRISTAKTESVLGFRAEASVKDSVHDMVRRVQAEGKTDFLNPLYYNIQWMTMLDRMEQTIRRVGSVFGCD